MVSSAFELVWTPTPMVFAQVYFEMAERASHLTEPLTEVVEIFALEIEANFEEEGRPTHWEELAEGTRLRHGSGPILQVSGDLKDKATDSFSWTIGMAGHGAVAILEDPTGYGIFHITGAPAHRMPARDWSYISDEAMDEMEEVFMDFVTEPWES